MQFRLEQVESGTQVLHFDVETDDAKDPRSLRDAIALTRSADLSGGIWVHGTTAAHDDAMTELGYTSDRTLLQMRRRLPASTSSLTTVELDPADSAQLEELIGVNNRAFSWHPEQSGMTIASARATMAESWFRADGVRLHYRDGVLAGFCWTKIHTEPEPIGEIYVICVDPAFHGQGLGKPMTLAGLAWLELAGLEHAMLYVESDNGRAVGTYHSLGFDVSRTDKLWFAP